MICRSRAAGPFQPVLVEKRGKGRLAERALPQDAEQRGHGFLALTSHAKETRSSVGCRAIARLRAGTKAKIDDVASLWRGKLEMRDLMEKDIGLGIAAQGLAVPAEVEGRTS